MALLIRTLTLLWTFWDLLSELNDGFRPDNFDTFNNMGFLMLLIIVLKDIFFCFLFFHVSFNLVHVYTGLLGYLIYFLVEHSFKIFFTTFFSLSCPTYLVMSVGTILWSIIDTICLIWVPNFASSVSRYISLCINEIGKSEVCVFLSHTNLHKFSPLKLEVNFFIIGIKNYFFISNYNIE